MNTYVKNSSISFKVMIPKTATHADYFNEANYALKYVTPNRTEVLETGHRAVFNVQPHTATTQGSVSGTYFPLDRIGVHTVYLLLYSVRSNGGVDDYFASYPVAKFRVNIVDSAPSGSLTLDWIYLTNEQRV